MPEPLPPTTPAIDGLNDSSSDQRGYISRGVSQGRSRFSLRSLLAAVTLLACAASVAVWIRQRAPNATKAEPIVRSLTEVAVGLALYAKSHQGVLPPPAIKSAAGKPLTSWRFAVYPDIHPSLFKGKVPYDLSAPWDAAIHAAIRTWPAQYCLHDRAGRDLTTNIFGVTGPDTAFDDAKPLILANCEDDLVMLIEVADSKTHWMQPGDYNLTELISYTGRIGDHLDGLFGDRLHVLFADGDVWALSPDAPMSALHPFLTITGAKANDRGKLLAPHRVD